jgi:GWxTD domain-containing protein
MAVVKKSKVKGQKSEVRIRLPPVACCLWLAVGFLLLPGLMHGVMKFSVDYAGFRSASPESTSVEIYHSVPYDQLHYQTFGDTIYAEYQVRLSLTSLATGATMSEALYEPAVIPSFAEAKKRQLSIAHSFSLNLTPGRYLMRFDVRDTQDAGSLTETLTVRDLSPSPNISDLVIGDKLVKTEAGMVSVLPRPSLTFGPAGPREMYVYVDGYGFTGDTLPYELTTEILDDSGRVVKSLPSGQKNKKGPDVREIFGLTSQGLKPGTYLLRVNLSDVPTGRKLSTSKSFYVLPAGQHETAFAAPESLTADESQEYHDLRLVATDQQLRNYQKLNATGKEEFLHRFWHVHDFRGYLERLKTADARYSWGHVRGRDTDEGRIYLKYGEPDETEAHTMAEETNPEEHWRYYNSGLHFVFVDVRSDGHYRMVWSNSETEHNDPSWQSLVDPQELDDLEHENSHD